MSVHPRVRCTALHSKVMSPDEAAALIQPGMNVGMSGFTGAGYPKAVPLALAKRIMDANLSGGKKFRIGVWTGASTAPELDGALAMVDGIELRLPYQSDNVSRRKINAGEMEYIDIHLSHVAQFVRQGFLGQLDVALIEVTAIREDGSLVPSSSVGNNLTWIDCASKVILEVNSWQNEKLEGMHDIFKDLDVPNRIPIPIFSASDRVGSHYIPCPAEKIIGIVETNAPDRNTPFSPPDARSKRIAGHIMDFLVHEVKKGRIPQSLLPLQSGVGNIANGVLLGLNEGPFENLTSYTEVIQDGMVDLFKSGKLRVASATAFSLSPKMVEALNADMGEYRTRIILRPQEISNHPGIIRRLGCLAMNGMIEADMYGNVNSTHVMGTMIQNGIGGSGDFARNAFISFFMAPSTAKNGSISCIVPMSSHVDHTEHDVQVIVTEQGLADLRGLSPKNRAKQIIEKCAHPDFQPALRNYQRRALALSPGKQTPHLLEEAFAWHVRYLRTGTMRE